MPDTGQALPSQPSDFSLAGRTALVTGSTRGIGLSLAGGLGRAGSRVVVNGRSQAAVAATAERLRAEGIDAAPAPFDVTDADAVEAGVARVEAQVGPIDILVNNAGVQLRKPLETVEPAEWRALIDVDLTGAFLVGAAVARRMIPRGRGKIINVCSLQSELARPTIGPYTAAKGGLKMLTQGMCADWAPHGIQVNAIAPGYFVTPMTQSLHDDPEFDAWLRRRAPAGRWGDASELIGPAVFLASTAADYVNGHVLYVDGGVKAVI